MARYAASYAIRSQVPLLESAMLGVILLSLGFGLFVRTATYVAGCDRV
jgi:hypothetical protein